MGGDGMVDECGHVAGLRHVAGPKTCRTVGRNDLAGDPLTAV